MRLLFIILICNNLLGQSDLYRYVNYSNGIPKTTCSFNKDMKKWSCTDYYINGNIMSNYYCDSNSYYTSGIKQVFGLYGELVYKLNYKNELLHGDFIEYHCNEKLKRSGEFYNGFRVGKWLEYHSNGKVKSIEYFVINKNDSIYDWKNKFKDSTRLFKLTLEYGIYDNLEPLPEIKQCIEKKTAMFASCKEEIYAYNGNKVGTWLYYDEKGKLIKQEKYKIQ